MNDKAIPSAAAKNISSGSVKGVPGRVVFSAEQIQKRVGELAEQISRDYEGKQVVLLAVLRGAVPFLNDLSMKMALDVTFDFLSVTRLPGSNHVHLLKDLDTPIEGRSVIIVEDIINEGETLDYLLKTLRLRQPKDMKICTMFDRPGRRTCDITPDYVGFTLEDKLVVGYGLDCGQLYRNLPYLAELNFAAAGQD